MADNTISALRVLQAGIEASKATAVLTMDTQPTADDTITIGSVTYTWKASGAVSGQINVGADLPAAKVNLVAAINGSDLIQDGPNPFVTAATFVSNNMTVTARMPGPAGNSIATTETFTATSNVWNHATLTGGAMTRGTQAAATERLILEQLTFAADGEKIYDPKVQNGILARYIGPGVPVQHETRFALPSQAHIWDQAPLLFSMLYGAPTVTGSLGGPYTMTWTVSPTANPNPYSVTLQRRLSNGLGDNIDEYASYCMLPNLGLAFAVNEELKLEGDGGFAREFTTLGGGITNGLSLPTFEVGVSALSTIYFDALFADVGTTLLAEQVIGWNLKFLSGVFARYTAEGRSDLSLTKHQLNGSNRGMDLQVTCLLDPTTYAAEVARASDPSTNQFAVRVHVDGSDSRSLDIDMLMQHTKPLFPPGESEGQDTITFDLADCTDGADFLVITLTTPNLYVL